MCEYTYGGPRMISGLVLQVSFSVLFLRQTFLLARSLISRLGWLSREHQESAHFHFPNREITSTHHYPMILGIKVRYLCLYSKHFTDRVISLIQHLLKLRVTNFQLLCVFVCVCVCARTRARLPVPVYASVSV